VGISRAYISRIMPSHPGFQKPKACRAEILIAHGVSRGLAVSKKMPEAQDDFTDEYAFASGMKTDDPVARPITLYLPSI
jgi:hypothetical protein